jgi:SAM-dependent MidA family methyltransferase
LEERLRDRIMGGPITFADFMEMALYDPVDGFYTRHAVGERGDFVTSPHVSPLFGVLVARQVEDFWNLLNRPEPFTVIEVGAGDGTMAGQVLEALPERLRSIGPYVAVERSETARAMLHDLPVVVRASMDEVEHVGSGCVLANELLDNLPFHRLRGTDAGTVELLVGLEGDRFVLVEGELSSHEVAELAPILAPGRETVVSPEAHRFVDRAGSWLSSGYLWAVDYGHGEGGSMGWTHGYRGHRVEDDVLADPGSRDITVGVDFDSLARHAKRRGHAVWGPRAQREVLLRLGFRDLDARAQRRQVEAIGRRRGIEALRIYSSRHRANLLLAEDGLGDFLVLCIGMGTEAPPHSMA